MAHPTHASLKAHGHRSHAEKVAHHRAAGGKISDKDEDEKLIKTAMREHDAQQHHGTHTRLKFKDGGAVEGEKAATRLDRPGHAKGGRTKGAKTHVSVIVAPQHPPAAAGPPMAPHPIMAPGAPPPGGPPPGVGGPPGAGGPPPGAMPPHPPMGPPVGAGVPGMRSRGGRTGRASGGKVGPAEDNKMAPSTAAGSKSGLGRLHKAAEAKHEKTGEHHPDLAPLMDTAAPKRHSGGRAC